MLGVHQTACRSQRHKAWGGPGEGRASAPQQLDLRAKLGEGKARLGQHSRQRACTGGVTHNPWHAIIRPNRHMRAHLGSARLLHPLQLDWVIACSQPHAQSLGLNRGCTCRMGPRQGQGWANAGPRIGQGGAKDEPRRGNSGRPVGQIVQTAGGWQELLPLGQQGGRSTDGGFMHGRGSAAGTSKHGGVLQVQCTHL